MRLAKDEPQRFTAEDDESPTQGKVYIDYLRNERGASAIAPYSPRARETPSVATPVSWTNSRGSSAPTLMRWTRFSGALARFARRMGGLLSIYGRKSRQRRCECSREDGFRLGLFPSPGNPLGRNTAGRDSTGVT